MGDFDIDPAIVGRFAEEVALDLATRSHIGVLADEKRDGIVAAQRAIGDHPADCVRTGVPRMTHLLEDAQLHLMLIGCGIGLGEVERDVAGGQRFEDRSGQVGEAEAAVDETLCETEALCDRGGVAVFLDEMLEGLAFFGRRHLQALEVLGQRHFARIVFAAIYYEAGNLEVCVHRAAFDDLVHGAHPLAASDHLEATALLCFCDDEVLQDAAGLDIEGQAFLELRIGSLADIVLALVELTELDELHCRIS